MRNRRRKNQENADLDITSFMNLMIILVPVLLVSMVLARTTVLDLKLPDLADPTQILEEEPPKQLELVITPDYVDVNYPAGSHLKRIEKNADNEYDYKLLATVLQEVKRQLEDQGIRKDDIFILSQPDTDYQTLITVMDTARSFKSVVAASVVDAALFPVISLGDAPVQDAPAGAQP